jgi:hypothetical protein
MKIYVAGKFEEKELIRDIYKKLREMGHEISYDWTTHKPISPYSENQELAKEYSQKEIEGISNADVLICIPGDKSITSNIEFGAALILAKIKGKPKIYMVGQFNDRSPWFFDPLVKRRKYIEEVLGELKNSAH